MELGYEDFPEEGTRVRASLLPFDGDRYSRAQKLFRVGSITAACVGALAIVGLLSSPATKAAPEWVDATVSVSPNPNLNPNPNPNPNPNQMSVSSLASTASAAPATSRPSTTSLATTTSLAKPSTTSLAKKEGKSSVGTPACRCASTG